MKKLVVLFLVLLFVATLSLSATGELRPIVKAMLARLGWIQQITVDYALSDFEKIKATAGALSAQAKKTADAADGPRKELNQKLSDATAALGEAADKKDGQLVATRIGEVLAVCNKCHATMRD